VRDEVFNIDYHQALCCKDELCKVVNDVGGVEARRYVGKYKAHPNI